MVGATILFHIFTHTSSIRRNGRISTVCGSAGNALDYRVRTLSDSKAIQCNADAVATNPCLFIRQRILSRFAAESCVRQQAIAACQFHGLPLVENEWPPRTNLAHGSRNELHVRALRCTVSIDPKARYLQGLLKSGGRVRHACCTTRSSRQVETQPSVRLARRRPCTNDRRQWPSAYQVVQKEREGFNDGGSCPRGRSG